MDVWFNADVLFRFEDAYLYIFPEISSPESGEVTKKS